VRSSHRLCGPWRVFTPSPRQLDDSRGVIKSENVPGGAKVSSEGVKIFEAAMKAAAGRRKYRSCCGRKRSWAHRLVRARRTHSAGSPF